MTYEQFTVYPLEIQGITDASDEKITAIENDVIEKLEYSGDTDDLYSILPYFVFYFFMEDLMTNTAAKTGETRILRDESTQAYGKMVRAWNEGATKLAALIAEDEETCTENFTSLRTIF